MDRTLRILLALVSLYTVSLVACYASNLFGVKRHNVESACFIFGAVVVARVLSTGTVDSLARYEASRKPTVLIVLVGVAVLSGGIGVGLLSDDYVLRRWIEAGHLRWVGPQFARPVAQGLWSVVFTAGGGATSLHVLNITLHILNSILVWRLGATLGLTPRSAYVAAAVFLLWPTQVEPVVWAAGIFDVLSTFFMLTALSVTHTARPTISRAVETPLVATLTLLALFSKESAVALPGLFLLTRYWASARVFGSARDRMLFLTMLSCTAAYFGWRLWAQLPLESGVVVSRYVLKEQISRTIASLALPVSETTARSHPWLAAAVSSFVPVLVAISLCRPGRKWLGIGLSLRGAAWCVIAAAPTVGLLVVGAYLDGSRYLYCATLGWGFLVGGLLDSVGDNPILERAAVSSALAVLVLVGIEQQLRLADWRGAAVERDRLLAEAIGLADRSECRTVSVSGLPPRFQGAQLFNNGFSEALDASRPIVTGHRQCEWRWTGIAFEEVH